jgi:hypothetical protein
MTTTPSCCAPSHDNHGHDHKKKRDWMLIVCGALVATGYIGGMFFEDALRPYEYAHHFAHGVVEFVNTMWWGVLIGIVFLGLLSKTPRDFIMSALGTDTGAKGILRATMAGVLLDLCSHGILMVGAKIYERGASIGQVMAFWIASPWNSLSITIILFALIGVGWTLLFIVLSLGVAIITGLIFDTLVKRGTLPANPNKHAVSADFRFWREARAGLKRVHWSPSLFKEMLASGVLESRMVIRWLLFGIVLAATLRVFLTPDDFQQYFGPTMLGLSATVLFATILEVCSEGSAPIAADLFNRGGAFGNAFAFLMAGVSTDYTEVMVIKETTKSWKIALFLPLVTLPQIILLGVILNAAS